ncbi:MAG: hypothetical protein SGI86_06530 [Deltaproteobacteria bacterium]|nr:hypothetical protein [Deltaproteobacteria bacterium]
MNASFRNPSNLVLGIDEAGRGPALGPLVLAAVALDPVAAGRLTRAGVTDSKKFGAGPKAHAARKHMASLICKIAHHVDLEVCDVATVDAYVARGQLNHLERERARLLIARAPLARRIVADGARLFGSLTKEFPMLEAHDGGEAVHVAVASASILAKIRRDELFGCISDRYAPEFGTIAGAGYVNGGTHAFTNAFKRRRGRFPPEARQSWPWPGRASFLRVASSDRLTHE